MSDWLIATAVIVWRCLFSILCVPLLIVGMAAFLVFDMFVFLFNTIGEEVEARRTRRFVK